MDLVTRLVSRIKSRLPAVNPVLVKELRSRMNGSRPFWILVGYLLGLGLLTYGLYQAVFSALVNRFGPSGAPQNALIGQALFVSLSVLEMILITFIAPALTARTISGEIEGRTYDLLLATGLRPGTILWGKLLPALTYVWLLILASLPMYGVALLFGGVALRDLLQALALRALTALTWGMLGLFFSALTRRTARAAILSYGLIQGLLLGTLLLWLGANVVMGHSAPFGVLYLNPVSGLLSAIVPAKTAGVLTSVVPPIDLLFELSGGPEVTGYNTLHMPARPLWHYTAAFYLVASAVLYLLTAQLIKPARRWQFSRWGWVGLVLLAVLLVGGLTWLLSTGVDYGPLLEREAGRGSLLFEGCSLPDRLLGIS